MLASLKHRIRNSLSTAGIDVRLASKITGADVLNDVKKLNAGKPVRTIIDIGANIGQSALRFHEAFPEAVIHSFEPVATSYQAGLANTARCPAVKFHHLAVGNENKPIVFYTSGTSQMNSITHSSGLSAAETGERNEVDLARFDDFAKANQLGHIDLFKTDTEGLDLAVLEGAHDTLSEQRATYVVCEVGFNHADTTHTFFPPVAEYLERFGYRLVGFYGISKLNHFQEWGVTYADALFTVPRQMA
jgi:FkbM family methyltransferase